MGSKHRRSLTMLLALSVIIELSVTVAGGEWEIDGAVVNINGAFFGFTCSDIAAPDGRAYPDHCKTPALLQKTERPKPTTHAPPDTTPVYNASTWDEDLDKQNVQVTNGERDCTSWCYWVAPTWVWGEGHWWPVIKTSTPQFLKYCFCSPIDQSCTHFLPNNFQDPFRSPVSVCSRCSTDWAWRRVWVWDDGNCDAHQRWLKVPSGCYCTLLHAEYCLSTDIHYPWDYRLPNLETTDEDEGS